MTNIRLHGVLAKEYGQNFSLNVGRPKNVLHAIDANRDGFIARMVQLHKEGCIYEVIINNTRLTEPNGLEEENDPATIDLVPVITGSGPIAAIVATATSSALIGNIVAAVFWAALSFALSPQPELQQIEATAQASKSSLIFSNTVNTANQGAPLPVGYGRLKVGSQVIQATIKSYPQHQPVDEALPTQGSRNQRPNPLPKMRGPRPAALATNTAPFS
jgi:predicted phage tail protein